MGGAAVGAMREATTPPGPFTVTIEGLDRRKK